MFDSNIIWGGSSHDRSPKFPTEGFSCDSRWGITDRGRPAAYPPCLRGHFSGGNSLGRLGFRGNRDSRDPSFSHSLKTITRPDPKVFDASRSAGSLRKPRLHVLAGMSSCLGENLRDRDSGSARTRNETEAAIKHPACQRTSASISIGQRRLYRAVIYPAAKERAPIGDRKNIGQG